MPTAILYVATFLVSVGVPAAVAVYAAIAIIAVGLNSVMKALTPKMPKGDGRSLEASFADSVAGQRIIFGTQRVGGCHMIPLITTGSKGRNAHMVIVMAGHEVSSIGNVYFDDTVISSANITAVTGTANDGLVTGGKFANVAWVRRYTGTSTQTVDYILNIADTSAFSSSFRLRGWTYVATQLLYDANVYTSIPAVTALVSGAKVYDPRLDSTNGGSGTQRYNDSTTWLHSSNPALCTAWYLISTLGGEYDPATEIDWSLVTAAANICDQTVNVPSPTSTQKRYTCNGMLIATAEFNDNLQQLIDSMLGRITWRGGQWRLFAGAWNTPVLTIDRSDFIGAISFETVQRRREGRWNGARCYYVDPSRNYQRVECLPQANATYYAADGSERIWIELEQPMCNTEYEAQRKAQMILRQSRNGIRVSGKLGPRWQQLSLWDTVYLDWSEVGFNDKTFRIVSYTLNPEGSVDVVLSEEMSTDWSDMTSGEYDSQSIASFTQVTSTPDPPLVVTTISDYSAIQVSWQVPSSYAPMINQTYELWEGNSQYLDASYTNIWEGAGQNTTLPKTTGSYYYYKVRSKIPGGYVSTYTPTTGGTYGVALSAPSGGGFNIVGITASYDGTPYNASEVVACKMNVSGQANVNSVGYRWAVLSSSVSSTVKTWSATNITSATATYQMSSLNINDIYALYLRGFASDTVPTSKTYDLAIYLNREQRPGASSGTA
ncbi:Tip attachment protein J [uncultured Caudovirales phage]|uniref:Tip attachment protein J n=1 Tax=uncultured Caudovirales phage TaxID=2100421 RepID=A0A6J5SFN7_9CAUD|nr:Tip attachment protein J [uncultured Caudovirales phage]CAB4176568.1 Tip attachment protein J [uncultured Caudovirales phage]CAB4183410.1 Tip attachment protein J [uncultured Caudovirales phage]CAB4197455.1 Tip attachment protein J [uncultured Caudovirales phage]CAB4212833.1 Tip attachment protein J [uncultured Caudovirales phage]